MSCAPNPADADRCPTQAEIVTQLVALLPSGRAWGQSDGVLPTTSIVYRFWNSVAAVFEHANQRICALREEFFCATATETKDRWLVEYGLPDACDPFPDLCAKVGAIGGQTCAYFVSVAAAVGWTVTCRTDEATCGAFVGQGRAGRAVPGRGPIAGIIELDVDLGASDAFTGVVATPPRTGRMRAGMRLSCGPDVSSLRCVLERVIPAHCTLVLNLIPPPSYWMVSFGPTSAGDVHLIADDGSLLLTE